MTHPIIGDPIIVIIMVTFITETILVMIFLARVGEVGAVILWRNKGSVKEAIISIMVWRSHNGLLYHSGYIWSGYLFAVVGSVGHTVQVSVGPSVQVSVLSADATVAGVAWLALAAEHGLGEDAQVDAVGIFVAVVAAVLARVAGFANLREKNEKTLTNPNRNSTS